MVQAITAPNVEERENEDEGVSLREKAVHFEENLRLLIGKGSILTKARNCAVLGPSWPIVWL